MNNIWQSIKQWAKETMTEANCHSLSEAIPKSELKYILHIRHNWVGVREGFKRFYGISNMPEEVEEVIVVHVYADRKYKAHEEGFCKRYGTFNERYRHMLEAYRLSGDVFLIAPYIAWRDRK
jgi:hypothetical protein